MHGLTAERLRNAGILGDERRAELRDAYRAEVAYTDRQLLRLVDALEAARLLDGAVVVFTADHGEEFWEHGGVEHGHSHHREVVEVPLVIRGPGMRPGRRDGIASLTDIVPTVLTAVGLPSEGVDLAGPVDPERVVSVWGNLHLRPDCSARSAERRVIARGCGELPPDAYDLFADPAELRPFDPALGDPVRTAAEGVTPPPQREATRQTTDALEALGYVD
jgi:hypothetical protein